MNNAPSHPKGLDEKNEKESTKKVVFLPRKLTLCLQPLDLDLIFSRLRPTQFLALYNTTLGLIHIFHANISVIFRDICEKQYVCTEVQVVVVSHGLAFEFLSYIFRMLVIFVTCVGIILPAVEFVLWR